MLDLSYIIQDMTNTEINTTAEQFKLITDKKDEPDYKAVSKFVGGMVECVQFPNGDLLLLNEEGKLMGLPLNPEATALWRSHFPKELFPIGWDDVVVGPAIVIQKNALDTWSK
tara:strand:+ start:254 stop:592 length:339 start_codon:yes stop_codon:yes gene_type:complete